MLSASQVPIQDFLVDSRFRQQKVWREGDALNPREVKGKQLTSSCPDAILITPYKAKPASSPSTSCSHHHALRSRHNPTLRATTANR
eukprot:86673-Pelagomonas_calceolata.AAC.1